MSEIAKRIRDPNAPKLKSEYMEAFPIEKKPKTWIYGVVSHRWGDKLGLVRWYAPWRQYCFFPENGTIFNPTCMGAIIQFIKDLMKERRKSLSKVKNGSS